MTESKKIFSVLILGLILVSPINVFAQTSVSSAKTSSNQAVSTQALTNTDLLNITGATSMPKPAALTSCFDYYHYDSTPVNISGSLAQAVVGTVLPFSGTIQNSNDYPIPNVSLWAKVVRSNGPQKDENGPDVVDWFQVADNLTLPANGSVPVSGSWKIPVDAKNGNYEIITFVVGSDRFNFDGLTFTDDVVGQGYNFTAVSGSTGSVQFDKDETTAVGYPYSFAEFPPEIQKNATAKVVATIVNNQDISYRGTVDWKLYSWDAVTSSHLLDEKTVNEKMQPNSTTTVSYTITDTTHSVYYLVGTLQSEKGSKSIIGIRLVRDGINTPRLAFVGIDPSSNSQNGTAVACIHSTGLSSAEDSKVIISVYRTGFIGSLLNLFGPIASVNYQGAIPTDIYALTVPVSAMHSLILRAQLYQNGAPIDDVSVPYCTVGGTCSTPSAAEWLIVGILILVVIIFLILVIVFSLRRRRNKTVPNSPPYV